MSRPFDLLILDIDGIMTSGHKYYDNGAEVVMKAYSDLDFTAIKRFKLKGFKVCFLSGDTIMFVICTAFAVLCGYNFCVQLEGE